MARTSRRSTRRGLGVLLLTSAVVAATAFAGRSSSAGPSAPVAAPRSVAAEPATPTQPRVSGPGVFGLGIIGRPSIGSAHEAMYGWTEAQVAQAVHLHAAARGAAGPGRGVPPLRIEELPTGVRYLDTASADGPDVHIAVVEQIRVVGWERFALLTDRALTVRPDAEGLPDVVGDQPDGSDDLLDLTTVRAAHRGDVLVLGDASEDTLATIADVGAASLPKATAFWGPDWARRVVVVAPATLEEFAGLLGDSTEVAEGFAAVTAGRAAQSGHGAAPADAYVGSRVYVNPDAWDELSLAGEHIVLAHEFTHVAAQAASRAGPPTWLSEGVADQVGFTGAGIPEDLASGLAEVRASGPPAALPGPDQFSGQDVGVAAAAYAQSDIAVRLILRRYGLPSLRRVFRDASLMARNGDSPDDALTYAFDRDLHTTLPAFTKAWQDELVRLAGR